MINLNRFKVIPGFSKYMISEDGIIYSIKRTWKTLTDSLDNYFIEECSTTISEESTP